MYQLSPDTFRNTSLSSPQTSSNPFFVFQDLFEWDREVTGRMMLP
jgi:hypothetical protein